jgi:hypothetical protein
MIFSEDRLLPRIQSGAGFFRIMLEGSQARAAEIAGRSSVPALETAASESAAFHKRGEEDLVI